MSREEPNQGFQRTRNKDARRRQPVFGVIVRGHTLGWEAWRMRNSVLAVCLLLSGGVLSCNRQLTPEETRTLHDLRTEQSHVTKEIEDAQARDKALEGGLLKVLIAARIEILKTTEALLEQSFSVRGRTSVTPRHAGALRRIRTSRNA